MNTRIVVLFTFSLIVLGRGTAAAQIQRLRTDGQITQGVKDVLRADLRVRGQDVDNIDVLTIGGRVTLRGEVSSPAEKFRAELLARKVSGVTAVTNTLRIRSRAGAPAPDAQIETEVRRRLRFDPLLRGKTVNAAVQNGVVTLSGQIETVAQKQRAQALAREIRGVKMVRDNLDVSPSPTALNGDERIKLEIQEQFGRDIYLHQVGIQVSVSNGMVTLTGIVPSLFQKSHATDEARLVLGVISVDNRLELSNAVLFQQPPAVTDNEIRELVRTELHNDPRVDADGLSASVLDGRVVLSGTVRTLYEKQTAERVVRSVVGVQGILNEVKVENRPRNSDDIHQQIQQSLASDSLTTGAAIEIKVDNGAVTLSGMVRDYAVRFQAARLVSRTPGVRVIHNQLISGRRYSDAEITEHVSNRLRANWATRVVSDRIRVQAKAGIVTLTGEVPLPLQRIEAGRAASYTRGVLGVENQIRVAEEQQ